MVLYTVKQKEKRRKNKNENNYIQFWKEVEFCKEFTNKSINQIKTLVKDK